MSATRSSHPKKETAHVITALSAHDVYRRAHLWDAGKEEKRSNLDSLKKETLSKETGKREIKRRKKRKNFKKEIRRGKKKLVQTVRSCKGESRLVKKMPEV